MTMLFDQDESRYVIVIPQNASAAIRHAAEELSSYLAHISGVTLPILPDNLSNDEYEICLGDVNRSINNIRSGMPVVADLVNDGYRVNTVGKRIYVVGQNDRAILYGVYALLEEGFGCRFLASGVEHVPIRCDVPLPFVNLTRVSPFEYRECFWWDMENHQDFAVKRGMNASIHQAYDADHGHSIQYFPFVHSFVNHYVPISEYGESHPEYYSMIDGKRKVVEHGTQLCLTNPEVYELVLAQLKQDIQDHPEASVFSLSQADCYFPCECPECAAIDKEEGCYMGTMLRFVNKVANAIAEEYPHILIDTLAYHYTRQAPKITRPAPNVTVRLCTIEGCFTHPLEECDVVTCDYYKKNMTDDMSMRKDFNDWSRICNRLSIWDYQTNFTYYLNPMGNVPMLQKNIQYFIRNHVTSLFEQGNGQSPSGELGELKAYLTSKLMWEPEGDVELWTQEFMEGYYGRAAAPLMKYLKLFHEHIAANNIHMGIRVPPTWGHMPPELLLKVDELFDRAEALAEDDEVLARVQRSRLAIRFVKISYMSLNDPARKPIFDAFKADVKRLGLTHIRESSPDKMDEHFDMFEEGTF